MVLQTVDWTLLGQQVGLGALLGLAIGFTFKKAFKIALIFIGVLVLALIAMQSYDLVSINWPRIEEMYYGIVDHPEGLLGVAKDWAIGFQDHLPVAGSFLVGFLVGLRLG